MVSTALIEWEYKGVGNEYTGRFCGKTKAGVRPTAVWVTDEGWPA